MPKRCHNERLLDARHYPYADGSDDCCIRAGLVVEYYCLPRLGKVTGSAPMSKRPLLALGRIPAGDERQPLLNVDLP